jgi:hypothetical protein
VILIFYQFISELPEGKNIHGKMEKEKKGGIEPINMYRRINIALDAKK